MPMYLYLQAKNIDVKKLGFAASDVLPMDRIPAFIELQHEYTTEYDFKVKEQFLSYIVVHGQADLLLTKKPKLILHWVVYNSQFEIIPIAGTFDRLCEIYPLLPGLFNWCTTRLMYTSSNMLLDENIFDIENPVLVSKMYSVAHPLSYNLTDMDGFYLFNKKSDITAFISGEFGESSSCMHNMGKLSQRFGGKLVTQWKEGVFFKLGAVVIEPTIWFQPVDDEG